MKLYCIIVVQHTYLLYHDLHTSLSHRCSLILITPYLVFLNNEFPLKHPNTSRFMGHVPDEPGLDAFTVEIIDLCAVLLVFNY